MSDDNAHNDEASDLEVQSRELEREVLALINRRAQLERRLGELTDLNSIDFVAERQVLDSIVNANQGPLDEAAVRAVFRELLSAARSCRKRPKVAFLGPRHSYSHLATLERFGDSVELAPVMSIAAVFEEIVDEQAEFGIVPIENSTDGRIADTLDMFARHPVRICGEVQLRIHHCLLGRCRREEVQEVYSKPQAISQCRDWLSSHLSHAQTVEITSTAAAAELAAEREGVAAIASRQAGVHHQLEVIAANIEDSHNNITRFAVIGGEAGPITGADKTALMFELPHRPGALADAMNIFRDSALNLTWIESFPIAGSINEYLFFVEFEGNELDDRVATALQSLTAKTSRLEILGSYPKSPPLD